MLTHLFFIFYFICIFILVQFKSTRFKQGTTDEDSVVVDDEINIVEFNNNWDVDDGLKKNCNINFKNVNTAAHICNVNNLNECNRCFSTSAKCVHLDEDIVFQDATTATTTASNIENVKILPKNQDPLQGYCLTIEPMRSKCSAENGGVEKIVFNTKTNRLEWICHCQYPNIFTRGGGGGGTLIHSNCSTFVACASSVKHNAYDKNRKDMTSLYCQCASDEIFIPFQDGGPKCMKKDIYQSNDIVNNEKLHQTMPAFNVTSKYLLSSDDAHIDLAFRKYHNNSIPIINPCLYDYVHDEIIPEKYHADINVVSMGGISQCFSHVRGYATITYDSDYLQGNGGKYPNGIVRVVTKQLNNNNNDDNDALDDVCLYETGTRNDDLNQLYQPLEGYMYDMTQLDKVIYPILNREFVTNPKYPFFVPSPTTIQNNYGNIVPHNNKEMRCIIYSSPNYKYQKDIDNTLYAYKYYQLTNVWILQLLYSDRNSYLVSPFMGFIYQQINKNEIRPDIVSLTYLDKFVDEKSPINKLPTTKDNNLIFYRESQISQETAKIFNSNYRLLENTFYLDENEKSLVYNVHSDSYTGIYMIHKKWKSIIPILPTTVAEVDYMIKYKNICLSLSPPAKSSSSLPDNKVSLLRSKNPADDEYFFTHDQETDYSLDALFTHCKNTQLANTCHFYRYLYPKRPDLKKLSAAIECSEKHLMVNDGETLFLYNEYGL